MTQPISPKPESRQRPKSDWIVLAAIFGVFLLYLGWQRFGPVSQEGLSHPAVGQELEAFEVDPLLDAEQSLSRESLRGKVALINLWGPWCFYCRLEMPHLVDLKQRYAGTDFQLVSVSYPDRSGMDREQLQSETAAALRLTGEAFPVHRDPRRECIAALKRAGIMADGLPCTVLVGRDAVIRAVWLGYRDSFDREMDALVSDLVTP